MACKLAQCFGDFEKFACPRYPYI